MSTFGRDEQVVHASRKGDATWQETVWGGSYQVLFSRLSLLTAEIQMRGADLYGRSVR